jgi:hypothetical protein
MKLRDGRQQMPDRGRGAAILPTYLTQNSLRRYGIRSNLATDRYTLGWARAYPRPAYNV